MKGSAWARRRALLVPPHEGVKDVAAAVAKTAADAAKVAVRDAGTAAAAAQIDMESKKAALKDVYDNCQTDTSGACTSTAFTTAKSLYDAKKATFDTLTNTLKGRKALLS